ncbi:copper amine oxidase N-terminal domain-containing protein [Paenibacillus radicis (ex Xue et al. 2023)]|uniref:Copper amine oxidase N-terminal domain-containing protein n=1 Tax=Paenibacillus radicis (ex Xue et al. 2023) TaxID=2972489 RepID=A0ABT1YDQ6_9BACL|nr:copper amine oxidase N-terminal domain-containing protein [Paenibacillus radicis (ex Xue et al. 2023)]MCR8631307.1 copper amine oxidase N-terminal domain-containing protein [Paenibacillus radicis (ex Xue et al. 2023)]
MRIRRFAVAALSGLLLFSAAGSLKAEEMKVGAVIGEVLSTDITAYVNGLPIPSMNIGGYTAVAVEDLRGYGFDVAWSPETRKLSLYENAAKLKQTLTVLGDDSHTIIGTKLKDVVYTDIKAYYGNQEHGSYLRSYNIGGTTAVLINDLEPFGSVQWDAEKRSIKYDMQGYKGTDGKLENPRKQGETLRLTQTSDVEMMVEFAEDKQYVGDKEVGIGQEGVAYFSLSYFAEAFGYSLSKADGGYFMDNGLYSIRIEQGGTKAILYWGGAKVNEYSLLKPLLLQGGKPYMASYDHEQLFGYTAKWNQNDRVLDISYAKFDVEDYGLPREVGGDSLSVKGTVRSITFGRYLTPDKMRLSLDNSGIYGNMASAWGSGEEPGLSLLEAPIALTLGSNQITETLRSGERILYRTAYEVTTSFSAQPLVLYNPGLKLDNVTNGYIHSDSSRFELSGTAVSPFHVVLAKQDGKNGFVEFPAKQTVTPEENGHFRVTLDLAEGDGLYKVKLYVSELRPRAGLVNIEAGYFYIMNSTTP